MSKPILTIHYKKYCLWLVLSLPGIFTLYRYLADHISYGQVIHETGDWSVALLVLSLAVTPLKSLFSGQKWLINIARNRRALGVASFGYAAFHTLAYLERKWGYGYIQQEVVEPGMLTGWIGLFIFIILAVTSNNFSVRRLKSGWQKLHRTVYLATALIFTHWILTAFEPLTAYICLGVLILIECFRLIKYLPPKERVKE